MLNTSLLFLTCLTAGANAPQEPQFHAPVRLQADDAIIKLESPGYAAPAFADVDGDGKKDLVVGQFKDGKMTVFKNQGEGKFAKGEWLEADGEVAKVAGVW